MRIVAVADTHTFEKHLVMPDGDVFIHAGDMLRAGTIDELEHVADWIIALPHRHKVIVAGNHDWCFLREREASCALLGGATYLQDASVTIDGVTIYGAPWQPEYHSWAFNLPRGAPIAEKWAQIPPGIDVLVTHGPPATIGDHGPRAARVGCEDLLARVRTVSPKLHLFGHIHQDGGFWRHGETCFANVTTWECERAPTVIDVIDGVITPVQVPPSGA